LSMINEFYHRKQIIVVEGSGKGKTTFAMGIAARNTFIGGNSVIVQFMKGYPYSETGSLERIPNLEIKQTGTPYFVKKGSPSAIDLDEAERGLQIARESSKRTEVNLLVLDEINVAVTYGLLQEEKVKGILSYPYGPDKILLTGRYPTAGIVEMADVHIVMQEVSHPFHSGVMARKGIDY